ncbi:hypothetical protein BGX24_000260 [Mortierella sp. AD032]|nr:hypothetical protein BGX24_000260 [Mortierella sp. AD032]
MPSTIDLKSAIESCDILCRFALHYENQVKNSDSLSQATVGGSALGLDPIERASLQKIRSMNTTMLIGIQKAEKMNDPSSSSSAASKGPGSESLESDRVMMEEDIELDEMEEWPLRFGPGQPWNVMVLELARAATSIFQLAIRIKAWVNMTPEERELDEEINMIRGKRCLLMDSTLAVPTVDQHGNLQKDWAVVPASTSTSKSFYQRQRDLEQQRQTHSAVLPKQTKSNTTNHHNIQAQSTAAKHDLGTSMEGNGMMVDRDGTLEGNAFKIPRRNSSSGGVSSTAANRHNSLKNEGVTVATAGSHILAGAAAESGSMIDSEMSSSFASNATSINSSFNDASGAYRSADGVTRNSKNSDVPHQKYRKRAKRSQAPGRCQSCHSSDTPEWRRGPDGARTLCNACGLHYAKLLRRQNEQAQQSPSRISSALPSSNSGTTLTNNSSSTITTSTTSTSMMFSAPLPPVSAPTPTSAPSISTPTSPLAVSPASGGKVTSHPSSRMDSSCPVISFPFRRLHGLVKTDINTSSSSSATSTATATATTATSTANVMATTTASSERSGLASLSLSFSSDGRGRRTLAEHQVVPRSDTKRGHAAPIGSNARHRVGYGTNTSQYQLLQRQQQQYQQMECQKPQSSQHQGQPQQSSSYMRDDVDIDEARVKRES